jgi:uncharacterized protein YndB with AHSA1/START domain
MGKFTVSVFINRSPQDVFNFLSDPANLSKWNSISRQQSGSPAMHLVSAQRTKY